MPLVRGVIPKSLSGTPPLLFLLFILLLAIFASFGIPLPLLLARASCVLLSPPLLLQWPLAASPQRPTVSEARVGGRPCRVRLRPARRLRRSRCPSFAPRLLCRCLRSPRRRALCARTSERGTQRGRQWGPRVRREFLRLPWLKRQLPKPLPAVRACPSRLVVMEVAVGSCPSRSLRKLLSQPRRRWRVAVGACPPRSLLHLLE